jgi:septal ring-binding cell division protein DamX
MCGSPALARVDDVWLCAGCGLKATQSGGVAPASPVRRMVRRGVAATALSAGLLTKMMIGAVAVAAVGVASIPLTQANGVSPESTTVAAETSEPVEPTTEEPGQPAEVSAYVETVHDWTDCVKQAVDEHMANEENSRKGFDPRSVCGEPPKYVGRDGELPAQASDNARENRLKNEDKVPGEPNGKASDKTDGAVAEETAGSGESKGNQNSDKGNGKGNG